jgi:ribosomal protein S27E
MATRTDFPEFRCDDCGSVSIVIEGPLTHTAPVKCCGCDAAPSHSHGGARSIGRGNRPPHQSAAAQGALVEL